MALKGHQKYISQDLPGRFTCTTAVVFMLNSTILTFLQIVDKSKRDPTEEIEVRFPILSLMTFWFDFVHSCDSHTFSKKSLILGVLQNPF